MKKNLSLLIVFLAGCWGAMATNFYSVGTVTDSAGNPIANQTVCLRTDSTVQTAFTYNNCVQTDSLGRYAFGIPDGANVGPNIVYYVSVQACNTFYGEHIQNAQGTVTMVTQDFVLGCNPNAGNCQAAFNFNALPANSHEIIFQATVPANTYYYNWDFGDGAYASTADPAHVFSDTGAYNVCLTIYNGNGCQNQLCQWVYVADTTLAPPSCVSSFSYYVSNDQVYFYQTAGDSMNPYFYNWNFSDGGTASGADVWYSFANSGLQPGDTVQVCLTIYNSTGCQNTACQNVVVPGSNTGGCDASFSYADSAGYVFFNPINPSSGLNYYWSFGNGTTASDQSVVRNLGNGTFNVCLYVYNSLLGCADTVCQTIVINDSTNTGGCVSAFTFAVAPANSSEYSFQASVPANTYFYNWSFGDGGQASSANPSHLFTTPGTYTVCLTIYNNSGCQDQSCQTITITGGSQTYDIDGRVFRGNDAAFPGYVRLIVLDSLNAGLALVQQAAAAIDSAGNYHFGNVPAGQYLVKAELSPNSSFYSQYLPTYFGDVLFWNAASTIVVPGSSANNDINMIAGSNPGGPGFVGGLVSQGANKVAGPGDPVENSQVMILNMSNAPFQYNITGVDGAFSFSSLPYGTYKIYTEVAGLPTEPIIATIAPGNETITDVEVVVNTTGVTTSIENVLSSIAVQDMYPNPAKEQVTLNMNTKVNQTIVVKMYNVTGNEVATQTVQALKGELLVVLPMDNLATGIYTVKISAAIQTQVVRRIVKL